MSHCRDKQQQITNIVFKVKTEKHPDVLVRTPSRRDDKTKHKSVFIQGRRHLMTGNHCASNLIKSMDFFSAVTIMHKKSVG